MARFRCDTPCYWQLTYWDKGAQVEVVEEDVIKVPWCFTIVEGEDTRPPELRIQPSVKLDKKKIEERIKELQEMVANAPLAPEVPEPRVASPILVPSNQQLKDKLDELKVVWKMPINKEGLLDLLPTGEEITLSDGTVWTKQ